MHIEQELEEWLKKSIPDKNKNKRRDIKVVLNYYGFGDLASPTLEQLGSKLQVGTRERTRQVINDSFRNIKNLANLPTAEKIFGIIESHDCISISELKSQLVREGLASENTTIRGLLKLARDFDLCKNYEIYDTSLEPLSRSDDEFGGNAFLIKSETRSTLKKQLKKARTLPGQLGLANFEYLHSEIGNSIDTDRVIEFIRCTPNVCIVQDDEWYIFEDRDNYLLNSCEKVFSLTSQCSISVLSSTLANALRRRSHKYAHPSSSVIEQWIKQSKWFVVEGLSARFIGEPRTLTKIEEDARKYLLSAGTSGYPRFRDHLLSLGHGKPSADKVITTSPLVTVDKSGERKSYTYRFISMAAKVDVPSSLNLDRYEAFKNQLKEFLATGTDAVNESTSRREQSILQKWLFADQTVAECAICGESFSVSALITAHKKKRSLCTDSERVDPHIVFPLCRFGCDFLYERGIIRIEDGVVQIGSLPTQDCTDRARALALSGRKIESRWLKGSDHYFKRNLTS